MKQKKVLAYLLLAFLATPFTGRSQLDKGHVYASAFIETKFNTQTNPATSSAGEEKDRYNVLNIIPRIGIAISKQVELGAGIGYSNRLSDNEHWEYGPQQMDGLKTRTRAVLLNVYSRINNSFTERLGMYGEFSVNGSFGNIRQSYLVDGAFISLRSSGKARYFDVAAGPGIYYKAGKRIIFDARFISANYSASRETLTERLGAPAYDETDKNTNSHFSITFLTEISMGLRIRL